MTTTHLAARAGTVDDIRREDDDRGYERDETDAHHRLGRLLLRMVREADAGVPAERRARRSLAEMVPGYVRPPLLSLTPTRAANDACPLCGYWRCRCGGSVAPAGTRAVAP